MKTKTQQSCGGGEAARGEGQSPPSDTPRAHVRTSPSRGMSTESLPGRVCRASPLDLPPSTLGLWKELSTGNPHLRGTSVGFWDMSADFNNDAHHTTQYVCIQEKRKLKSTQHLYTRFTANLSQSPETANKPHVLRQLSRDPDYQRPLSDASESAAWTNLGTPACGAIPPDSGPGRGCKRCPRLLWGKGNSVLRNLSTV